MKNKTSLIVNTYSMPCFIVLRSRMDTNKLETTKVTGREREGGYDTSAVARVRPRGKSRERENDFRRHRTREWSRGDSLWANRLKIFSRSTLERWQTFAIYRLSTNGEDDLTFLRKTRKTKWGHTHFFLGRKWQKRLATAHGWRKKNLEFDDAIEQSWDATIEISLSFA